MIVCDLKQWDQEKRLFAPVIQKAVEWISLNVNADTAPGKYEIDGKLMYALVQQTNTQMRSEKLAEAHRDYIDVQYLLSGEELIGAARDSGCNEVWSDELQSHDRLLYKHIENEMDINLKPNQFVIFYPSEIHRACCNVAEDKEIKKVVIKIHHSLFE